MNYPGREMVRRNNSFGVEFILLGFSDLPHFHDILFGIFLVIYMSILLGNGLIIFIAMVDPALQTPMYFFLGNFSFLEICYTSVTIPRMLTDLWTQKQNISLFACAVQLGFLLMLGATECFLLTVMAYDRYVAICKPLNYPLIMNHKMCVQLVSGSWTIGIPVQLGLTYQIFSLPFCGSKILNHIFCDIRPVLKVACGDTSVKEFSLYAIVVLFGVVPFLLILWSYIKIIGTILKLPSAMGRSKAFSTCSSHVMVVGLFFLSVIITYLQPKSTHSEGNDKFFSLFYTIITPMFNPIIYALRNKDVLVALRKFFPISGG
ncbi:olfactory receptor 10AG1-like [Dromiciops gliroides]|uniref:olfactory receptor 10AG1-like n=1 Tax=Dromiciops gliroides TaxID=33562 RepID=UPI001CC3404C|nr:olfactory receptor 10AG1-like [Dromiciops gliroides]